MFIYNVTVKVEAAVAADWLQWLLEVHAPALIATHCFTDYRLVKLLEVDDTEGPTYAVQYLADSMEDYNRFVQQHAAHFQQLAQQQWGNRYFAFNTLMQVVK